MNQGTASTWTVDGKLKLLIGISTNRSFLLSVSLGIVTLLHQKYHHHFCARNLIVLTNISGSVR